MDAYIGIVGGGEDAFAGAMGGTVIGIFLLFYFLIIFLAMAFSIASYVLHSLGLYSIADRRGLRHKWLAWLPIGNAWLLGSISDQYQYVAKGKIKNRRKVLLGLKIGEMVMCFVWYFSIMIGIVSAELPVIVGSFGGGFAWMVLAVVLLVFEYLTYYDLFRSCQPSNAVLYLILSIVFSVTLPFFVFFIRKKDLGMPPRKQSPVAEVIAQELAETSVEETVEELAEEITEE